MGKILYKLKIREARLIEINGDVRMGAYEVDRVAHTTHTPIITPDGGNNEMRGKMNPRWHFAIKMTIVGIGPATF